MKNKALTYILLIVVGAIWYQVFFRVKGNLMGDEETVMASEQRQQKLPPLERDTVDLKLNYKDPFGITKKVKKNPLLADVQNPVPTQHVRHTPKPQFIWPQITYYGQVRKTYSKKPLAILKIDNIQLMMRNGEEVFDGIILKTVSRDSIQVKYKGRIKTFYR